ncbi:hypothetical protein NXY56_004142 [Leishmania guyanensis]
MSATDPYSLSLLNGAETTTLFQVLFPAQGTPATRVSAGDVLPVKRQSNNPLDGIAGALAVSSPSVSERIRAWEMAPNNHTARLLCDVESSEFDYDQAPMLQHTEDEQQEWGAFAAKGSRVQHPDAVRQECDTGPSVDTNTVPFSMRVREVERRFWEQVKVHRGLTAASRHVDVLEHSVRAFQAERRTRAFVQALAERQGAIWARVWPGGSPPAMVDTASTVHDQTSALVRVIPMPAAHCGETPASVPLAHRDNSAATPSTSSAASPPPPASPTGSLLRDILDTYSKPRELRETSGGSAAPAATAAPDVPRAPQAQKGAPLAPAGKAQRTVAGVEIVRPEEAPTPYTIIRYVVARSKHVSAPHDTVDRQGISTSSVGTSVAATTVCTASSKKIEREEEEGEGNYSQELSTVRDEVYQASEEGADKVSTQSSDSIADAAASIDGTYSTDTFNSHVSSRVVDDSISSAKGPVVSSSIPTEEATSSSRTRSTASEEVEGVTAGHRSRGSHRGRGEGSSPSGADDARAAPFAEVLRAFLDACRCVSAASARLLQSRYIRETSHGTGQQRQHTPQPAKVGTSSSTSSAIKYAGETAEEARGTVSAAWREDLHRQLRNVRHLQHFRDHLLRHLKLIDVQWQTRQKATRLLKETKALAKVRSKLLSGSTVADEVSMRNMLRHVAGISKGAGKGSGPRCSGSGHGKGAPRRQHSSFSRLKTRVASDHDTTSEVLFTEMNSSGSDAIASTDTSAVEEEMQYGSDQSGTVVSDSIIQEEVGSWNVASGHSEVASSGTVSTEVSRSPDSDGDLSYASDSFEAASNSDAVVRSAWIARSGMLREVGLDEIEEELADRLAELSSDVISEGNSIPSEVEELVDLLPSSLIRSEIEDDTSSAHGNSAISVASYIATDMSSSAEALQVQQRRMYVGVKGSTTRYTAGGDSGVLADHKAYIRDSPGASVYSVPEDADVDTSMPQSTDARSEGHSGSLPRTSGGVADFDAATSVESADERQSHGRSSPTLSTKSYGSSSRSEDALTALEVDMGLTKERRHHALRWASGVPTFEQLYNPSVLPPRKGTPRGSSRSSSPDRQEGGPEHNCDAVGSSAAVPTFHERGTAHVVFHPTARMEAGTQAETCAVDTHPAAISGAARLRTTYPTEDYVAQNAWKARQLHLLRQLRSPIVGDSENAAKDSAEATGDPSHDFQPWYQPPKDTADPVLDAAEAAAREEWAQHWGVVESLLQTRFSVSPRADRGELPPPSRPTRTALLRCLPSDSTPPSRGTSQSSVPVSSASR